MMRLELTEREAQLLRGILQATVQYLLGDLGRVNRLPHSLTRTALGIGDTLEACDGLLGRLRLPYSPANGDGGPPYGGEPGGKT